jgi:hypothetical protein
MMPAPFRLPDAAGQEERRGGTEVKYMKLIQRDEKVWDSST